MIPGMISGIFPGMDFPGLELSGMEIVLESLEDCVEAVDTVGSPISLNSSLEEQFCTVFSD